MLHSGVGLFRADSRISMNCLVFDIETVPDIEAGRRIYEIDDAISDSDVAEIMFTKRREQNGQEFLALPFHRVVAISAVLRSGKQFNVWSLGAVDSDEKEIITRFYDGIERFTPTLVSWNGSGFDLPVLHYRSLLHGIIAPRYWDTGEDDRDFKWNNYLNRYHSRHTDLMDVLAAYQQRAITSLEIAATLLGFPGKMGMSGASVWSYFQSGKIKEIRDYCETDVLNTYLVYLRWLLISGRLSLRQYDDECIVVREFLAAQSQTHFTEFLNTWQEPQNTSPPG